MFGVNLDGRMLIDEFNREDKTQIIVFSYQDAL